MPAPPTGDRIHGYLRPEAFTRRVEGAVHQAGSRALAVTVGSSVERRTIRAVVVAGPSSRPDDHRPQAAVVAALHGNEVVTSELALRLLEMACTPNPTGPVSDLLEVADLVVVPCANPDGRARALASLEARGWWRPAPSNNASGVDLNRNWPSPDGARSRWTFGTRVRGLPGHRGPAPLSEPETRSLDAFLTERRPFVLLDLHSPGRTVEYPSGTKFVTPDDLPVLRAMVAAFTANQTMWRYRACPVRGHPRAGTLDNHLYAKYRTLPLTIETGEPAVGVRDPLRVGSAFWRANPLDLEANLANDADACFTAMRAAMR